MLKLFGSSLINSNPQNLVRSSCFSYVTSVFESHDLRKLCKIMNQPFYKFNEDIEHLSQIKLLDSKGKIIGTYDIEQAKKKAEKMKCDIVLINENTTPPICKAFDYKDHLYKLFIKEFVEIDKKKSKEKKSKQTRTFFLSTRITEHDLRNKIRIATEASKNGEIIKMAVKIGVEVDEDDATNTLYTFRDLSSQHLVPIGDVVKTEPSGKNADDEEEEDEGMVYLEFQNPVIKTEEVKDDAWERLTDKEMKKLIDLYFQRSEGKYKIRPSLNDEENPPEELIEKNQSDEETISTNKKDKMTEKNIKKIEKTMKSQGKKTVKEEILSETQNQTKKNKNIDDLEDMEENDLEGKEDLEKLEKFTKEFQDLIKLAKTQQVLTKRILHLSKLHKK